MSAMNLARSAAGKPVRNLTPVAAHRNPTEFLDTYCREHPLEGWVVGVETLYSSLPESRVGGADGPPDLDTRKFGGSRSYDILCTAA